jgi:hypothetical protein
VRNSSQDSAYCYHRAAEYRLLATRETNPKSKQEYLEREAHWMKLAANNYFSEQFNGWLARLNSAQIAPA